jgi:DNA-binding NarL/FixJ family response regulator
MTIRVLVADDQAMVRAGFRMLLAGEEGIQVVAEASNGREAVRTAERLQPTVILMDIRMPEVDGLEATRCILANNPTARVLILTTFDLDEYIYEGLRAGASGFVLKDGPAGAANRGHPHGGGRRRAAVTRDHEKSDQAVHSAATSRPSEGTRRTNVARTRDPAADRGGSLQRGDRASALHQ